MKKIPTKSLGKRQEMENLIEALEDIYQMALDKNAFASALKAKEMMARLKGLLTPLPEEDQLNLRDLSKEQLKRLIEQGQDYQLNKDPFQSELL